MIALACILWALGFVCLWSIVAAGSRGERKTTSGTCSIFNRVAQGEITADEGADLLMKKKRGGE